MIFLTCWQALSAILRPSHSLSFTILSSNVASWSPCELLCCEAERINRLASLSMYRYLYHKHNILILWHLCPLSKILDYDCFSSPRGTWVPARVEVDIVYGKAFGALRLLRLYTPHGAEKELRDAIGSMTRRLM